jgi:probable HAF family extracellular repeat protein
MRKQTLICILLCCLVRLVSAQQYSVQNIPSPGKAASPGGINSRGDVVGGNSRPFLWTKSTGTQDLGTMGGPFGEAVRINDREEVVGSVHNGSRMAAFLWTQDAGMGDLGTLSGGDTFAESINENGDIVGASSVNGREPPFHAVLWWHDGTMLDLGQLTQNPNDSWATGINGAAQVAGLADLGNNNWHAFFWTQAEGMQDLGTLGGPGSQAWAINDHGQIVGGATLRDGSSQHAFLWTETAGMQDLGTLGPNSGQARDINRNGHVVGGDGGIAFVWTAALGMKALNSLIAPQPAWRLYSATSINSAGQITVWAYRGTSRRSSAVLLTPIMATSLASSENPSNANQAVTFTVGVSHLVQGPPPDGEMVTFKDRWRVLASVPLVGGVASFTTSRLGPGSHLIQANYSGDTNYHSSKSAVVEQVVEP